MGDVIEAKANDRESKAIQITESTALTPMDMLSRAVANGASMEMIEKLMALHERWEKNQARKAFDEAVSSAKAKIPPIIKNREGHNSKKYADFAALARVVDPIISEFGLSYRFRTTQDEIIRVTCILSHRLGHSEENTLSGPADATGSKNAIQAIGSTLTYLQRYSLTQALGLAAANDDDGNAAGGNEFISEKQAAELEKLIKDTDGDVAKFCAFAKVESLKNIFANRYDAAVEAVKRAADARKAKKS